MNRTFLRCLRRTFKVFYGFQNHVNLHTMEFYSENANPTRFSEVVAMREEFGTISNLSLQCDSNSGLELIFCILNLHTGVNPKWLSFIHEEEMCKDVDHGSDYFVRVKEGKIYFDLMQESEWDSFKRMYACGSYDLFSLDLSTAKPRCFVLDAENKRIAIDSEGFVLDDDLNRTNERLFTPEELIEFATSRWFVDTQHLSRPALQDIHDWIDTALAVDFPLDSNLQYNEKLPDSQ